MDERIIDVANEIRSNRYKEAEAVFAAGSIVRGEGTPFSDLDLVVVYAELRCAFRESFRFGGYPVEAFVHDPATLEYFFAARSVDRFLTVAWCIRTLGRREGETGSPSPVTHHPSSLTP